MASITETHQNGKCPIFLVFPRVHIQTRTIRSRSLHALNKSTVFRKCARCARFMDSCRAWHCRSSIPARRQQALRLLSVAKDPTLQSGEMCAWTDYHVRTLGASRRTRGVSWTSMALGICCVHGIGHHPEPALRDPVFCIAIPHRHAARALDEA